MIVFLFCDQSKEEYKKVNKRACLLQEVQFGKMVLNLPLQELTPFWNLMFSGGN